MTRIKTRYLSVTVALLSVAVTLNAALTTGLVAYYDFDDLANDAAGSAAALTEAGTGRYTGTAAGVYGKAAEFTGKIDDCLHATISFGAGSDLGSSFTIAAWYNLDTDASNLAVPVKRFYVFESADLKNYDLSYGVRNFNGGTSFNDTQTYAGKQDFVTHNNVHTPGVWQHVLITYVDKAGKTTVSTYIDGVSVKKMTEVDTSSILANGIHIGNARNGCTQRAFDGKIDEFAAWSRVLNPSEIAQVYRNGVNGVAVTAVPESTQSAPSTLLGLGGISLILRPRK